MKKSTTGYLDIRDRKGKDKLNGYRFVIVMHKNNFLFLF